MQNTQLGILVMLVSTTLANLAAVLQKRAVDGMPAFDKVSPWQSLRAVLRSPTWLGGVVFGGLGAVTNFAAVGLADISVVQPLNGFGLVVLAIASRFYLGERLTPRTLAGIAAVIAGVLVVGFTAPPSRVFSTVDAILDCYAQVSSMAALAGMVGVILFLLWVAQKPGPVAGMAYALIAAACAALMVTCAKGFVGLMAPVGVMGMLKLWPAYLLGAGLSVFGVLTMALQQFSFQKGRAIDVTPTFAAGSVLLPLVMGQAVFGETLGPGFLAALALIALGVVVLGRQDRAA